MKYLLDANLSPKLVAMLTDGGFEAVHVSELGLLSAGDDEIFGRAADDSLVVARQPADG